MIEFLKGMDCRKSLLDEEKRRIRGCVETMQEAIYRNNFSRHDDGSGVIASGFSPDKVFRVLMNSERDIEVETRNMVSQMKAVYEREDQLDHVRRCLQKMGIQEQYLLKEVYVKDNMVDSLVGKLHYSRSHLYRMLQKALDQLLDLYNSTCLQAGSRKSVVPADTILKTTDRIVTLSTCTEDSAIRMTVQGKLIWKGVPL